MICSPLLPSPEKIHLPEKAPLPQILRAARACADAGGELPRGELPRVLEALPGGINSMELITRPAPGPAPEARAAQLETLQAAQGAARGQAALPCGGELRTRKIRGYPVSNSPSVTNSPPPLLGTDPD